MQSKQSAPDSPSPEYPGPGYPVPQVSYVGPQYLPGSAIPAIAQPVLATPSQQVVFGKLQAPSVPVPLSWAPAPPAVPNCPPGLEYLSKIDQLVIHQQIELMEMISGYETCNRYEVKNTLSQLVYFAAEENDDHTLNKYRQYRPFTIKLFDSRGQAVMLVKRPVQICGCCCPCICCLDQLEVQAPPDTTIGYVKQTWHPCLPRFSIQNEAGMDMLKIIFSCGSCCPNQDLPFEVVSLDGSCAVGRITKQWTGMAREAATKATNFEIQFPLDLDIKMKAVLLGTCFLLDFMYFEQRPESQRSQFSE